MKFNWRKAKFGDVAQVITGSTPSTQKSEYFGGEIPFVTPAELDSSLPITISKTTLTTLGAEQARILPSEAVMVCCIGSLGKVGIAGMSLVTNQQINSLIFDKTKVFPRYGFHYCRTLKHYLEHIAPSTTLPIINKSRFSAIEIPLPPLPEQKRIAEVLDKADALREKRRLALQKLGTLLQSVFLEMFGDPVKNPKGWKKEKIGNLMVIRRGGSPRPIDKFLGGEFNWIKIGDATKGDEIYLESSKEKIIKEGLSKTVFLKAGSLIFANCGVSLGFARILKIDGCIHDGWLSFENIPENQLDKIFLLKALNNITNHFRAIAPSGTQPNLNTEIMKNFEIIVPPLDLQKKFSAIVEKVEKLRGEKMNAAKQADNLFQSLQQRAFKGELFSDESLTVQPQEEQSWRQTSLS